MYALFGMRQSSEQGVRSVWDIGGSREMEKARACVLHFVFSLEKLEGPYRAVIQ